MIWHRANCFREINDQSHEGGSLLCADALRLDLNSLQAQVQCVYLDPPGISGEQFFCKIRLGEAGWVSSRQAIFLPAYADIQPDCENEALQALRGLLLTARGLLTPTGSIFLHTDHRLSARARLLMDEVFGAENFRNEIIWSYQTGGRSRRYFNRRHDGILFYAKSSDHYFELGGVPVKRKESRSNHLKRSVDEKGRSYRSIMSGGKEYIYYDDAPVYPDDVWADVSQMQQKDPQRTGYPEQKPQALLDRMILSTTRPGDLVADLTCGSGTALLAAAANGRRFLGVDSSRAAYAVCRKRLDAYHLVCQAPMSDDCAMLDAATLPGIGYYTVSINAFMLPEEDLGGFRMEPKGFRLQGLDCVDQWYAGLLNNGVFTAYASSLRTRQTPRLQVSLEVPLLRGTVAVMVIDVLGRRTLWVGSPAL
jgi:DNA modification methylase